MAHYLFFIRTRYEFVFFFVVVVCHLSISVPHAIYRLCISFIETKSGEYRVNKSIPTFFFRSPVVNLLSVIV